MTKKLKKMQHFVSGSYDIIFELLHSCFFWKIVVNVRPAFPQRTLLRGTFHI